LSGRETPAGDGTASAREPFFSVRGGATGPRTGTLNLRHGPVRTPVFMPVGTQGTVKTLSWEDLESLGYGLLLANTYHLLLRPGPELLESAGGLHRFTGWNRGFLTDSGGFQVFSLANRRRVSEEGVEFTSHVDGARKALTPENVMEAQWRMGVDIAMCLDECPAYPSGETEIREMMERTLRWAARAKTTWMERLKDGTRDGENERSRARVPQSPHPSLSPSLRSPRLFPIVQGGTYPALRRESARRTVELDFPGYAVGGLSVGEPRETLGELLDASVSSLPADRPRYLMGVGRPEDVLTAVEHGIDMMDCVWPTRNGRNGQAMTWDGPRNLRNARYRDEDRPLDPDCGCPVCLRYTRRYLSHLFRAGEYLGLRLLSLHNLAFMIDFLRRIEESIDASNFLDFKARFLVRYRPESEA
jgi:queuine tRNA-ribosyltransferase